MNKEASLGDKINWFRIDVLRMTQEQLAKRLGLRQIHSISQYETGKTVPGIDTSVKMVLVLEAAGRPDLDFRWLRHDLFEKNKL